MDGFNDRSGNCVGLEEQQSAENFWVDRRRRWTEEQKRSMVDETFQPAATVSSVARKYKVPLASLFRWRRLLRQDTTVNMPASSITSEEGFEAAQIRRLLEQIKELQRLLGKMTLENEMLREAVVQVSHERRKLVV